MKKNTISTTCWLHYVEETDHILCFVCLKAVEKKVIPRDKLKKDNSLVNADFSNWRKATEKFNKHERSEMHSKSVQKLAALDDFPIDARLSSAHARKQATARHCSELLFRTTRFLGSKGIAFRGDTARGGILFELMLERTYDLPERRKWIEEGTSWMSDTIQNELIENFAHAIQRETARSSHCWFY